MSNRYAAFGTILRRGDGATPEQFTPIAGVESFGGPALSLDVEDVTSHDSADAFEEVVPTIVRTGDVSIELRYDPADPGQKALLDDLKARKKSNYEMEFPDVDSTTAAFGAYVTSFEPDAPHGGALTASVTLKVDGKVTFTTNGS